MVRPPSRTVLAALSAAVLAAILFSAAATGADGPPANTAPPAITGTPAQGQTLTASTGSWSGTQPLTYTYQWRRCGAGYLSRVLADAPTTLLRLGETSGTTAADEQQRLPGTYQGGVTLGAAGALTGDTNPAASFDGVDDLVTVGNPGLTGPFTVELWAFLSGPGTTGATGYATLAGYDYTHRLLWQTTGSNQLLAQFDGNFFSTSGAAPNAWHHIVYTFDGSAERFYVDGAAAGTHPTTRPVWNAPFQLASFDGGDYMFKGRLDEFALYPGALTASQVAAHYAARAGSSACTDIAGATATTYVPAAADVGSVVRVAVTASNTVGSQTSVSAPTAPVVQPQTGIAPANTALPTVTGTAQVGQTLTASPGSWTGTAPIAFAYQWRRCDQTCTDIGGSAAQTYVPVSADIGLTLRVAVTATNSAGTATATSAATAAVQAPPSAPANTTPPLVTGTPRVGQTLTASTGGWTGTQPLSYAYQWRRCGDGYSSAVLADAPLSYWRLGEASGTTAADERGGAPGTYQNGIALGAAGALSGDPNTAVSLDGVDDDVSFANPNLTGPFSIELWAYLTGAGPAGGGYVTLVGYDYTHRLLWQTYGGGLLLAQFDGNFFSSVGVSQNAWHHIVYSFDGTAERYFVDGAAAGSHATTLPAWRAPFLAGTFDGTNYMFKGRLDEVALYSKALTVADALRHFQAGPSSGCTPIAGATGQSYQAVAADVGLKLQVAVTASNTSGSATASSALTDTVTAASASPANTSLPTISGTPRVGQALTASPGSWSGTAPITYAYQWRRCDTSCNDVSGATSATYVAASADLGLKLAVVVTATNSAGSSSATSAQTAPVQAAAAGPVNTSLPTISGNARVGDTLVAAPGAWTGSQPITYAYQWRRCGAPYRGVVLGDTPQSYWRLGESSGTTAADERAVAPGTYVGGATLGQPGAIPEPGTAVALDGVDDAVSLPNPNIAGAFSIELWAYLAGPGSSGATTYATLAGYDYNRRILWQTNANPGKLLAQFDGNFFSTVGVSQNAWHHIVYSYDGSAERFFIDGVPAGTHPTTLPTWQAPFFLGAYDRANYMFRGRIDDAAIYAGALSPTQVVRHYESGLAAGCRNVVGATSQSHLVVPADRAATLSVTVTATNADGSTGAQSASTADVAAAPPPASPNPIQAENALPGSTDWLQPDATGSAIEGYASQISALPGGTVDFHVSTNPAANYRVDVYRLGWYGGAGARRVACLPTCGSDKAGVARSVPAPDPTTGLVAAGWPVTDSITVPSSWVSGYYLARLVLTSGVQKGSAGSVFFILRAPPTRHAPVLVSSSENTWEAYNDWGGKSLYGGTGGPAVKVSFDRPGYGQSPMIWEYPLVRFLEREGLDVSYTTNHDVHADPAELLTHKVFVSSGHDEYWTKAMRDSVEAARDAGVNLMFLGGNDVYWQARYENAGRTLVEYRSATTDPEPDPTLKTVRWRELATPRPECTLVGVQGAGGIRTTGDPPRDYSVGAGVLADPWLANAEFAPGAAVGDLVGYEWDTTAPGCAVPPLTTFFHYTGQPSNADAVRYTAPSGARVFAAGSVEIAWGLDGWDGHDTPPDPRLQQLVRNAFAALTGP